MLNRPISLCFLLATTVWFTACKEKAPLVEAYIKPPIPELNPGSEKFTVEPNKENVFSLRSGTTITVPQGIFLDKDGNPVTGPVELQYREFQDAGDIWLTGIPMRYDTAGKAQTLETAGMFEMRGFQNGQPVTIKPGANIKVRMASMTMGDDYNSYYLDEQNRNWKYVGYDKAEVNVEKQTLKSKVAKMEPSLKFPLNSKYIALNFEMILDIYYNNDLRNADRELTKSKAQKYGIGWFNVYSYDAVKIGGKDYPAVMVLWKNLSNKVLPQWAPESYSKVFPTGGKNYTLRLYKPDMKDSSDVKLEAVMLLSELLKFPPEYWEKNYNEAMKRIEKERERLQWMADVYREMEVSQFGIYNYDRLMKEPEVLVLNAEFKYDTKFDTEVTELDMVYFFPSGNRTVIKLEKSKWKEMPLIPDENGRLVTLLPDQKIAIYPVEQYASIDFNALKASSSPSYVFDMKTQAQKVDSKDVLKTLLGI